jgi:hypothetical protein
MLDEGVGAFVTRSQKRVLAHCEALLAAPQLREAERARLVALRAAAEAELKEWSAATGMRTEAAVR